MRAVIKLISFALRQVLGEYAKAADQVLSLVDRHFTDHSRPLPRALVRANDHAWKALGVALAGDGLFDRVKGFFAAGDDKGFREQVRQFLASRAFVFEGTPADFRRDCLADLTKARKAGLLSAEQLDGRDLAKQAADFRRYADPQGLVEGAREAVSGVADALAADYPKLAQLLRQPTVGGGPPLLAAAFAYFFRRAVATHPELARELTFDSLQQLAAGQEAALAQVDAALETLGERFDEVLEQLGRIETVVVETHGAVLDLHAELQRLGGLHLDSAGEVRRLIEQVLDHLARAGIQAGALRSPDSFSIRGEDERRAVRQLLDRFRQLPATEQRQVPALLNGLGKLQVGAGDFAAARQTFDQVAAAVADPSAQAEACFNAYRSALEQRHWDDALTAIRQAAERDPRRYALFPRRFEPRRILGAGGFGTAFLCHDRHFDEEVVVKALHAELERGLDEVFREARVLRRLNHPGIIGVRDCEYADPATAARPYIVMDYFPGGSLEAFVRDRGELSPAGLLAVARPIAEAMQVAHAAGVWHRDLKPDNVLIRKEGDRWQVKLIDFGLALRRQEVETSLARAAGGNTILGDSVAGTVKYAPPEQMGQLLDRSGKRVPVGPYSDVFAFGKLCCFALYRTTEPKGRHWGTTSEHEELREVLERCTEEELEHRHAGFEPVLAALRVLGQSRVDAERQRQERERQQREEAQAERQKEQERQQRERERQEQTRKLREGETKLTQLVRASLDRTRGRPTDQDREAVNQLYRQYDITLERANALVRETREQWQKERPRKPQPGETIALSLGHGLDMKFAWIPPGTFLMGSPKSEEFREPYVGADETQHKVTLTQGFYLGVHQVTRGQFAQFVKAKDYKTEAETGGGAYYWTGKEWKLDPAKNWRTPGFDQTDEHPVVCVSWNDTVAFCDWLTRQDWQGRRYRLPTEAEWEYACRAGTTTAYPWGDKIKAGKGWCNIADQTAKKQFPEWPVPPWEDGYVYIVPVGVLEAEWAYECRARTTTAYSWGDKIKAWCNIADQTAKKQFPERTWAPWEDGYVYTAPVGTFRPNRWGLYDVIGNVFEWCADWYGPYPKGETKDQKESEKSGYRVLRGGSWFGRPDKCRAACRRWLAPADRGYNVGCRVVLCLD